MFKLNRSLLPIKAHFFFFLAGKFHYIFFIKKTMTIDRSIEYLTAMGPILPQKSVIGKQLGIAPDVMGYVTFISRLVLPAKSLVGYLMDCYPVCNAAKFNENIPYDRNDFIFFFLEFSKNNFCDDYFNNSCLFHWICIYSKSVWRH